MSREEALQELSTPLYTETALQEDKAFVLKKLGLGESEWDAIMTAPFRVYTDYPNAAWLLRTGESTITIARKLGITNSVKSFYRK